MASIRRGHLIVFTTLFILCIRGGNAKNFEANDELPSDRLKIKSSFGNDQRQMQPNEASRSEILKRPDSPNIKIQSSNNNYNAKEQLIVPTTKPIVFLLAEHPQCKEDVSRICEDRLKNNFAILDCLQNDNDKNSLPVSEGCQHVIWNYKKNLTLDNRFVDATNHVCQAELLRFKSCTDIADIPGHLLSCLMDEKENMTDPQCKQYLTKMESIIFSDYRLIYKFADSCKDDINRFKCGRVSDNEDFHSQHQTIDCLNEKSTNLTDPCKDQILRIAELQSDDFHLDRGLFYACREDRENFCKHVHAGEGKVYKCLMKHKMEEDMSSQCRDKLIIRQKLISQDYKVSHGLAQACRDDIKRYKCRSHVPGNTRDVKLSFILLCLEDAMHKGQVVSSDCQAEMFDHRRSLMEDYRINPNIVLFCDQEIHKSCNGLEKEGRTIHCLMKLAKDSWRNDKLQKSGIGLQCKRELEALLKEVDPISHFRIDPALQTACQAVIDTACRDILPGDSLIITCLVDKIGTEVMMEDCEERLLEIQYFISRDFRLDPRLYKFCHDEASEYCNAPSGWMDNTNRPGNDLGPLIFPCLYRLVYHRDSTKRISQSCASEVKRMMRQRAVSVELIPEIEASCRSDLARYCSQNVEKGEELECLQNNFNKLNEKCNYALGNFTEVEAEHVELNHILMKACKPLIQRFCEDFLGQDMENSELMQCLIANKNNNGLSMNKKCAAGIEHFQLISLKDYRFNFKFKEACKNDVINHCVKIKTKADVIECLSGFIRDDILNDVKPRISKECKRQLKVELLQRNENINLDENLNKACKEDVIQHCSNVDPENGQVLECLKNNRKRLTNRCHKTLFNREKEIMEDISTDYMMMTACKKMIKQYCADVDARDILGCLKDRKDELDEKCKSVVLKRQIEQSLDYRLNPKLQKACKLDIPKFCRKIIDNKKDDVELEGKVVNCLKDQFRIHKLSPDCENQIGDIMRDAALNYQLNPLLSEVCKDDIKDLCSEELGDNAEVDGYGKVEECLKIKLQSNKIKNETCKEEVAKLMLEGKADIHTDPLLYKACALDIKHYCSSIPPGHGRQLSCMLSSFEDKSISLTSDCREKLKNRIEMFEFAAKVAPPDNLNELVGQIVLSKSKNYFLIVICAGIGIFFIVGLFCGRVTKRVQSELKNK